MAAEPYPVVTPNDDGIRPAGPTDACAYCYQKIGTQHGPECLVVTKKVKVIYSFTLEVDVPRHYTEEDILFHYNTGSHCADNTLDDLARLTDDGHCLCPIFECCMASSYE